MAMKLHLMQEALHNQCWKIQQTTSVGVISPQSYNLLLLLILLAHAVLQHSLPYSHCSVFCVNPHICSDSFPFTSQFVYLNPCVSSVHREIFQLFLLQSVDTEPFWISHCCFIFASVCFWTSSFVVGMTHACFNDFEIFYFEIANKPLTMFLDDGSSIYSFNSFNFFFLCINYSKLYQVTF